MNTSVGQKMCFGLILNYANANANANITRFLINKDPAFIELASCVFTTAALLGLLPVLI